MNNKEMIDSFIELKSYKVKSEKTLKTYRVYLEHLDEFLNKPFKKALEKDFLKYLSGYKDRTKNNKLIVFKAFYRYIYDLEKTDPLPDCLRRIETTQIKHSETDYRERIVTEDEYRLMLLHSKSPKEKALIETLYMFGIRRGELLSMGVNGIIFDGKFTRITVNESKTKPRDVIVKGRSPNLLLWVESLHPFREKGSSYVFFSDVYKDKPFFENHINKIISRIGKNAGIGRKIIPHDFRHTSISRMRNDGVPQTHIETHHGLEKDSDMMEVYDHNKLKDYEEWLEKRLEEVEPTFEMMKEKYSKKIEEMDKRLLEIERAIMVSGHDETIKFVMNFIDIAGKDFDLEQKKVELEKVIDKIEKIYYKKFKKENEELMKNEKNKKI